jgi:hypothetical protein
MGVTEATVKNHVHSILEKTGSRTRGEAAATYRVGRHVAAGSPTGHPLNHTSDEINAGEVPKVLQAESSPESQPNYSKNGQLSHNQTMEQAISAINKVTGPPPHG